MNGILLCTIAGLSSFLCARRSLGLGVGAALGWGYVYGIIRINLEGDVASQFIADASVGALYLSLFLQPPTVLVRGQVDQVWKWALALMGLATVLALMPFSHILLQLVGLRYAIMFVPMLLVGSYLKEKDLVIVARWLVILNLLAVSFGLAEYTLGIERFYPRNVASDIIYRSRLEDGLFRIPGIFLNAHAFGGTLVLSLPILLYGYLRRTKSVEAVFYATGVLAAILGVMLSATRSNAVFLAGMTLLLGVRNSSIFANKAMYALLILIVGLVAYALATGDSRIHRLEELEDAGVVSGRLGDPTVVAEVLVDTLASYPLGNGLACKVSVPYFLAKEIPGEWAQIRNLECEYFRLAITQGVVGVLLWTVFFIWVLIRPIPQNPPAFKTFCVASHSLLLLLTIGGLFSAGFLTGVPGSHLYYLMAGILARKHVPSAGVLFQPQKAVVIGQRGSLGRRTQPIRRVIGSDPFPG